MTEYRLAASAHDYTQAHKLARENNHTFEQFSFPTLLAWKNGELTGMLATTIRDNMIVAGPLCLKEGQRRSFTLIRLIDNYDAVMRASGITSYIFGVENSNRDWIDKINKTFNISPYSYKNGMAFYVRKL